jgi:hypothetical protein
LRVLAWSADGGRGPAPLGDVEQARDLVDPWHPAADAMRSAIRRCAAVSAARLAGPPPPQAAAEEDPFGLPGRLGLGSALLAAAVGARSLPGAAARLMQAVPPTDSGWEHAARYAVANAAEHCDDPPAGPLPGALRLCAPLCGVFDAPGDLDGLFCGELADRLTGTAEGRSTLVRVFAGPCTSDAQAEWRGQRLELARTRDPGFVLDVYAEALELHASAHVERVRTARGLWRLGRVTPLVLSTAQWWGALAKLDRRTRTRDLVRQRMRRARDHGLPYAAIPYRLGTELYWSVTAAGGIQ